MSKQPNLLLAAALLTLTASPAFAAPVVTFPDAGVYFYWFRTSGGTVAHPPYTSAATKSIDIGKHLADGGSLYIMDSHTGGIAVVPLTTTTKGAAVTVDSFHVPASNVSAAPASGPVTTGSQTAPAASTSSPTSPPNLFFTIVNYIVGLALIGGIAWFIRMLITTKGQLLVDMARKTGVDVPSPDDLPKTDIKGEGKYEPPPVVKVQKIPEAASRPIPQKSAAGFLTTDHGVSYEIGPKAISIGRVEGNEIVLDDSSVSRKHAHVVAVGDRAELVDDNSANGVFVNGQKISNQILQAGDQVHIGRVLLRYEK